MLSEVFNDVFGREGYPTNYSRLNDAEILDISGVIKEPLFNFYEEYGRAFIKSGRLQICHPKDLVGLLALVFGGDQQFSHKECLAFAYSAFGQIFFWSPNLGAGSVDLIKGEVYSRGALGQIKPGVKLENQIYVPFTMTEDVFDLDDVHGKPLFSRAVKKLGPLDIGECYGFFPALALGGSPELEYLKRVRAAEHFAIVAQTMEFNLIDVQGYGNKVVVRPIG